MGALELVSGACELPDLGARNQALIFSARVVLTPNHRPFLPPLTVSLLKYPNQRPSRQKCVELISQGFVVNCSRQQLLGHNTTGDVSVLCQPPGWRLPGLWLVQVFRATGLPGWAPVCVLLQYGLCSLTVIPEGG